MDSKDLDFDPEIVECEHKYEHCIDELCCVICHSNPSEKGCGFNYCCSYDDYLCDGNCEEHKKEGEKQKKKQLLAHLYEALNGIEHAIEQLKKEL